MTAIRQNIGRVGLRLRGAWTDNPQEPYMKMDVTEKGGSSFMSLVDNNTTMPPSASWQLQSQRGAAGQGVPVGGTTGQVLKKKSNEDFDTEWSSDNAPVTSVNNKTGNVTLNASDVGALPSSTKYGATLDMSLNTTDYTLTVSLKDQDGTVLNSKTVDLPIESVVVNGRYDATNKKIVLTLQSGSTIDVPVGDLIVGLQTEITSVNMLDADLVDDTNSTHKFVTAQEKQDWNNKSDFGGSYNDLTDKPTIPAAQIQSDWNQTDSSVKDFIKNKPTIPVVPTNVSAFTNDAGYLTQHQDVSGKEDRTAIAATSTAISVLNTEVGKYYRVDVAVETLAVTLPAMTDLTTVRTVVIYLTGGTTPAITFSSALPIYYHDGFELEAGKTYEVNALFNGSAWIIASVEIVVPTNEGE